MKKIKYAAMLVSLTLFVSAGAFMSQALAAEANKASQTITRAGYSAFRQRVSRIFYRQCPC